MTKLLMVGTCPYCGRTVTSRYPFEIGECRCKNPTVQVPLSLAIIPGESIQRIMEVVEKETDIPAEQFISELLRQTSEALIRGWKLNRKEKADHPTISFR